MLEIKKISKVYETVDLKQTALDNVSINFRECEFVSILGPSGSGKTTLLNIIGGLDRYNSGDLIINGISTKKYSNRDWDSYRNHRVGFVFQSYNLISHQSILKNVELALTLSGVSKQERKKRAVDALNKVGLGRHIKKRPSELSGGQMQRVAIARALVNNPDIILADEPTGALDTVTSKQVMDLLKEVAKDKLVIMVTHNAELANTYSTRIIKLQDGKIISDSHEFKNDEKENKKNSKKDKKTSMSLFTAFSLSLNNLLTKKGRTILTSFAGSIGIIGIALILSVSTGLKNYIDKIEEDALTSYPLTIDKETSDTLSILLGNRVNNSDNKDSDKISEVQNFQNIFSKIGTNDIKNFKKHIESKSNELNSYTSLITYSYSIDPLIYTKDINNKLLKANPSDIFSNIFGVSTMMKTTLFAEIPDNEELINKTYKLIDGKYPNNYDEIMLIIPNEHEISDLLLYAIGLKDQEEFNSMFKKIMNNEKVINNSKPLEYTLNDLKNIDLRLLKNTDTYKYNSKYNIYEDMSNDNKYMNELYDKGIKLKVVGIATFKSDNVSSFASGVAYTSKLTKYIIEEASKEEIVQKQIKNKDINLLNNKKFDDKNSSSNMDFDDLISVDTNLLSSAFGVNLSESELGEFTKGYMEEISSSITTDIGNAKNDYLMNLTTIFKNILNSYISDNSSLGVSNISVNDLDNIINKYIDTEDNQNLLKELENNYTIPKDSFEIMYKEITKGILSTYISAFGGESAIINGAVIETLANNILTNNEVSASAETIAHQMVEATMQKKILGKVGELVGNLIKKITSSFKVDEKKIASAFKFNLTEDEIKRIFEASTTNTVLNADIILKKLGYQDIEEPSSIYFYFKDFEGKEEFIKFLNNYNDGKNEEQQIKYTDITGVLISSVKVIVDAVSYVLIAFVSISLVVSSIMIGIITYISVLERTKEIGILRAIGASKKNISRIFNAETFIVGLISGLFGIGSSLLLLIPINLVIHSLVGNNDVTAVLPLNGGISLVIISIILTLIGGIIPSRSAAKKDPVEALRSE